MRQQPSLRRCFSRPPRLAPRPLRMPGARCRTTPRSDFEPRLACAGLAGFRDKELVQIEARVVPAAADTPQHCRVTGMLSPEIAFEVNLPDRWNGRFYMIGNGGHAGEALDEPRRAGMRTDAVCNRLRHGADQHRPRRAQGAERVVRPEQPAEGDRLRVPRGARDGRRPRRRSRRDYYAQADRRALLELLLERRPSGPASRRSASPTTSTASSPTRRGSIRPASRSARCGTRRR